MTTDGLVPICNLTFYLLCCMSVTVIAAGMNFESSAIGYATLVVPCFAQ